MQLCAHIYVYVCIYHKIKLPKRSQLNAHVDLPLRQRRRKASNICMRVLAINSHIYTYTFIYGHTIV